MIPRRLEDAAAAIGGTVRPAGVSGVVLGAAVDSRAVGKGVAVGKVLGKVPGKILVAHTEHCANLRRATSTRYRCELFVEKAATRDQEQCNTCSDRK